MENIKTELNDLIDEIRIADFFERIDTLQNTSKIEVKAQPLLNQLRMEYISGNISFDYYQRLKAWLSINVVIIVNSDNWGKQTKSRGFCQEIKDLISKGKLDKAIARFLEILQGKDEYNEVLLLSSQYHSTASNLTKSIITDAQANQTYAKITQAILALLKEFCED